MMEDSVCFDEVYLLQLQASKHLISFVGTFINTIKDHKFCPCLLLTLSHLSHTWNIKELFLIIIYRARKVLITQHSYFFIIKTTLTYILMNFPWMFVLKLTSQLLGFKNIFHICSKLKKLGLAQQITNLYMLNVVTWPDRKLWLFAQTQV